MPELYTPPTAAERSAYRQAEHCCVNHSAAIVFYMRDGSFDLESAFRKWGQHHMSEEQLSSVDWHGLLDDMLSHGLTRFPTLMTE